eukprot:scaffold30933_cov101-Isochrysis_galbana.AAC.3
MAGEPERAPPESLVSARMPCSCRGSVRTFKPAATAATVAKITLCMLSAKEIAASSQNKTA